MGRSSLLYTCANRIISLWLVCLVLTQCGCRGLFDAAMAANGLQSSLPVKRFRRYPLVPSGRKGQVVFAVTPSFARHILCLFCTCLCNFCHVIIFYKKLSHIYLTCACRFIIILYKGYLYCFWYTVAFPVGEYMGEGKHCAITNAAARPGRLSV